MRDLEVLRYRQVSIEVAQSGELIAALLAEAVHRRTEIGSDQAGYSRISRARTARLTSGPGGVGGHGD